MTDLTEAEQERVRVALLNLRLQLRGWAVVGKALGYKSEAVERVANRRGRLPSAGMAFRIARLVGVPVDDLVSGRYLAGACPNCGHVVEKDT